MLTNLYNRETFLTVYSQHPQFLQLSSDSATETDSDVVSVQGSISSTTTTVPSESSSSSLRRLSVDTLPSLIGSLADEGGQETKPEDPNANALIIRRACRYDCYCKCHTQDTTVSDSRFSRLSSLKTRCSDPTCQGAASVEEKPVIPSTFFRRAISQVMSSKSIKVRYELNTYRMVSEGSDAMRYVKHGNLEKLKMCIRTGEATMWDTAPDGWSLLHVCSSIQSCGKC